MYRYWVHRPGQHSNLAVNREEIAEVEEFFRERDKRHNRKPWGQNNGNLSTFL